MTRTGGWRVLAAAAVALAALTAAACGSNDTPAGGGTTTPPGDGQIGGAPTTPPGASPTATGGGSTPTRTGGNDAPTYPKDAKTYAVEFLRAWSNRNFDRVNVLGTVSARTLVRDSVNAGIVPNGQWTVIGCGPDPNKSDQTQCVVRNAHGDEALVKLTTAEIGFPAAVTEAPLDRTTYPSDPVQYARSVLDAFSDGNTQRVVRLSNNTVKGKLSCVFGNNGSVATIDGTYSKVTLDGQGGSDFGKKYVFRILTSPGGKPNAIKELLEVQC